jgi:hypothetical protein
MAVTSFSPLLGLALPTTGDLSGTWGTTVNDAITSLIDSAVAGTTTLSADADVTLSTTNGAANQARNAVILWTASNGATTRNITAPAQSKAYLVINAGTGSVVIRGAGPTTGVTIPSATRALVAWNGTDFVKIASNPVVLTTDVSGILPVANGGTGVTSSTGTTNTVLSNGPTLVAPVLGTPASGTVTNLTGTASININGTVGATTATTGAFTSVTASADSSFTSTGAVLISKGTTAERPAGVSGKLRFNTTTSEFEGYTGAAWASVGGSAIVNDTTTATNIYPLLASATSGTASTLNTSNAKLLYKPSTGEFQSSALVASNGLVVNSATVAVSYSIAAGNNAMSSGPISVNSGITVTVPTGSRWVVL